MKSDQISLEACVQVPVSSKICQIWKLNYATANSTVRYIGHFLINYLSEGDLNGPLSVANWIRGTERHRIAAMRHRITCAKQTSVTFFLSFPQATDDLRKMNRPYVIPHTYNTYRCRLVPGTTPPFNYTGHLHHHNWLS